MTDTEIIVTLAEFMDLPHCSGCAPGSDDGSTHQCGTREHLPAYLTSYDALAPVWLKASVSGKPIWRRATHGTSLILDWYSRSPRAHAEALAKAIASEG